MKLPVPVHRVLRALNQAGFEAYLVGGCVRDLLLGHTPHDFDLATSALPQEMKTVFSAEQVVETGLQHGTLTVVIDHQTIEITTFRTESGYTDHRHPAEVVFCRDVTQDLARRDFTINAMAYHPQRGLVDLYGGQRDLQNRLIRCVGNPADRFEEDALRILRALRFSSALDFEVEAATKKAIHQAAPSLQLISHERIQSELNGLLLGARVGPVLREYPDVITQFLPELAPCVGFDQHTVHHDLNVYEHTVYAVSIAPKDLEIRLALLLHDCGKPACFSLVGGKGRFYGHAKKGAELTQQALTRLRYPAKTIRRVTTLVERHMMAFRLSEKMLRRWCGKLGTDLMRKLIALQDADAHATAHRHEPMAFPLLYLMLDDILQQEQCFSLKQLAVRGGDLLALGVEPGPQVGALLRETLEQVIEGNLPNQRAELLHYIKQKTGKGS